jgi:hypothetical protein
MPAKRIVDAVSVGADQVICPCGKVIELEPEDPEPVEHAVSPSLKPLNSDWHFKPQCPHWPQTDFFQADYIDPESGDKICLDCMKINSQNIPPENPITA